MQRQTGHYLRIIESLFLKQPCFVFWCCKSVTTCQIDSRRSQTLNWSPFLCNCVNDGTIEALASGHIFWNTLWPACSLSFVKLIECDKIKNIFYFLVLSILHKRKWAHRLNTQFSAKNGNPWRILYQLESLQTIFVVQFQSPCWLFLLQH